MFTHHTHRPAQDPLIDPAHYHPYIYPPQYPAWPSPYPYQYSPSQDTSPYPESAQRSAFAVPPHPTPHYADYAAEAAWGTPPDLYPQPPYAPEPEPAPPPPQIRAPAPTRPLVPAVAAHPGPAYPVATFPTPAAALASSYARPAPPRAASRPKTARAPTPPPASPPPPAPALHTFRLGTLEPVPPADDPFPLSMHDLTHPHAEHAYLGLASHFALQLHVRAPSAPAPARASSASASPSPGPPRAAKVKMHACTLCRKAFPRPSGLRTHMNSHSGDKPYRCPVATCDKSFTVRSNAKRHLRTHGGAPPPTATAHAATRADATRVHIRWVGQPADGWDPGDARDEEDGDASESDASAPAGVYAC